MPYGDELRDCSHGPASQCNQTMAQTTLIQSNTPSRSLQPSEGTRPANILILLAHPTPDLSFIVQILGSLVLCDGLPQNQDPGSDGGSGVCDRRMAFIQPEHGLCNWNHQVSSMTDRCNRGQLLTCPDVLSFLPLLLVSRRCKILHRSGSCANHPPPPGMSAWSELTKMACFGSLSPCAPQYKPAMLPGLTQALSNGPMYNWSKMCPPPGTPFTAVLVREAQSLLSISF